MLAKTDTADFERTVGHPLHVVEERLMETTDLMEVNGPMVMEHSRWDHAVFASDEDDERIDQVLKVIHPNAIRGVADV